jgi:hypothetical protein
MASMDFFTVPTATFRVLFVFIVLSHDRRRVMHCKVTDHPSEQWTGQQIRQAVPWEAPKYLIRDGDAIFRRSIRCAHQRRGDRGSGHDSAIASTESICGTTDRIDSPRVPGSRHCVERDGTTADSEKGRIVAIAQVGAACTIDTNVALPSRSVATLCVVRSVPPPRLRLALVFQPKTHFLTRGARLLGH